MSASSLLFIMMHVELRNCLSCIFFNRKLRSSHMVLSDSRERLLTLLVISHKSVLRYTILSAFGRCIREAVN